MIDKQHFNLLRGCFAAALTYGMVTTGLAQDVDPVSAQLTISESDITVLAPASVVEVSRRYDGSEEDQAARWKIDFGFHATWLILETNPGPPYLVQSILRGGTKFTAASGVVPNAPTIYAAENGMEIVSVWPAGSDAPSGFILSDPETDVWVEYDGFGQPLRSGVNNVAQFEFTHTDGFLREIRRASDQVLLGRIEWDTTVNAPTLIGRLGGPNMSTDWNTVRYEWNPNRTLARFVNTLGIEESYSYDSRGRITGISSPTGTVAFEYEPVAGYVRKISTGTGVVRQISISNNSGSAPFVTTEVTALGATVRTTFDENWEMTSTMVNGNVVATVSQPSDMETVEIDGFGRIMRTVVDPVTRQTTVTYPDGSSEISEVNTQGNLVRFIDRSGLISNTFYDAQGRISSVVSNVGHPSEGRVSYTYNDDFPESLDSSTVDGPRYPQPIMTTFRYDVFGRAIAEEVDGVETTFTYDDFGRRARRTTSRGTKTYEYDSATGIVKRESDSRGWSTENLYNIAEKTTTTRNSNGGQLTGEETVRVTTTATGHRIHRSDLLDPSRNTTEEFNHLGLRTSVTDVTGTSTYTYDTLGRVVGTVKSGGSVAIVYDPACAAVGDVGEDRVLAIQTEKLRQEFFYDVNGDKIATKLISLLSGETIEERVTAENQRVTQEVNTPGSSTSQAYDSQGFPTLKKNAVGTPEEISTEYQYGAFTRLAMMKDVATGYSVNYGYNALGLIQSVNRNGGTPETLTYDARGNVVGLNQTDGRTYAASYDAEGRILEETMRTPAGVVDGRRTWAYDPVHKAWPKRIERDGYSLEYDYTPEGALSEERLYEGATLLSRQVYGYNASGRLTSHSGPGFNTAVTYDNAGRPTSIQDAGSGASVDISVSPTEEELAFGNGFASGKSRDEFERVTRAWVRDPSNTLQFDERYQYEGYSLIERRDALSDKKCRYFADGLARILRTEATFPYYSGEEFSWNSTNNLTTSQMHGGSSGPFGYRFEDGAPLSGAGFAWTRDPAGRATQMTSPAGAVLGFAYNAWGELSRANSSGTMVGEYFYDPLGRRVRKNAAGGTEYFVYHGDHLVASLNSSFQPAQSFVYFPGTTGARPLWSSGSGGIAYYGCDWQNAPRVVFDGLGSIVWRADYTAFRAPIITLNLGVSQPLMASNQYRDGETGLHYNGARYYQPEAAHYLTADPLGEEDGFNRFLFVGGSPQMLVDLDGLAAKQCEPCVNTGIGLPIPLLKLPERWSFEQKIELGKLSEFELRLSWEVKRLRCEQCCGYDSRFQGQCRPFWKYQGMQSIEAIVKSYVPWAMLPPISLKIWRINLGNIGAGLLYAEASGKRSQTSEWEQGKGCGKGTRQKCKTNTDELSLRGSIGPKAELEVNPDLLDQIAGKKRKTGFFNPAWLQKFKVKGSAYLALTASGRVTTYFTWCEGSLPTAGGEICYDLFLQYRGEWTAARKSGNGTSGTARDPLVVDLRIFPWIKAIPLLPKEEKCHRVKLF